MITSIEKVDNCIKKKDYKAALKLLLDKKTGKIRPGFQDELSRAWNRVGYVYESQSKYMDAIDKYRKSLRYDKDMFDSTYGIGFCYDNLDRLKFAERYYKKALAISDEHPCLFNDLGNLLYEQSRYKEACKYYEKALRKCKHKSRLWKDVKDNLEYAKLFIQYEKVDDYVGKKQYRKALSVLVGNQTGKINKECRYDLLMSWYRVGNVYLRMREYKNAIIAYKKALRHQKNDFFTLRHIGYCYSFLDRPKLAERYYRRAIRLRKDEPTCYFNLGNSLYDQDRFKEAIRCYDKTLELISESDILYGKAKNNILLAKEQIFWTRFD